MRVVPTGIDHGTLTLIVDGAHFEITSLREDVETDGRRAKVRFGGDFAADARRRDFTINALSVDARGQLHDYVGGLDDLAARRVRFIGDPEQRIAEDYLRILRFFRFSACYGEGPLDRDGLHACIARREGIATLSRERLGGEMLKILASPRCVRRHRDHERRPVCSLSWASRPGPRAVAASPRFSRRTAPATPCCRWPLLPCTAIADSERLAEVAAPFARAKTPARRHGQGRRRLAWRRDRRQRRRNCANSFSVMARRRRATASS